MPRSVLKVTAKIFDPLGFLRPFVIRLKCVFQVLCMDQTRQSLETICQ